MANVVLKPNQQSIPAATSVGAYLESALPTPEAMGRGDAPLGAAVETVAVAADGSLTFITLAAGVRYVAYVAAPARYIRFIGN